MLASIPIDFSFHWPSISSKPRWSPKKRELVRGVRSVRDDGIHKWYSRLGYGMDLISSIATRLPASSSAIKRNSPGAVSGAKGDSVSSHEFNV